MGVMADRLNSMVVRASSPDGQIGGVFRPHGDGAGIQFRDGSYRDYHERGLEHQLKSLLTAWWAGYERGIDAAIVDATGRPAVKNEPWDARTRRLCAEYAETVCSGMSAKQYVYLQTTGLLSWNVVIRDGALNNLDEDEFATEVSSAYGELIRDIKAAKGRLRVKYQAN